MFDDQIMSSQIYLEWIKYIMDNIFVMIVKSIMPKLLTRISYVLLMALRKTLLTPVY